MPETYITARTHLEEALRNRTARVAVVGLGEVGQAEAVAAAQAGFSVIGIDVDPAVVARIENGPERKTHSLHQADGKGSSLAAQGSLRATLDVSSLSSASVVLLCLPTPIVQGRASLSAIENTLEALAQTWAQPKLIVVVSTVPPGTTRTVVGAFLQARGLEVGHDYFLAVSPERLAPGESGYGVTDVPRVVGGLTPDCVDMAGLFFSSFVKSVHPVSSPEVAEAAKILENVFRLVNISLVNEWSLLCHGLGIDVWEVIQAASTKPRSFLKHFPGPGAGGPCIPWAPYYVLPDAHALDTPTDILEASLRINELMPAHIVQRTMELSQGLGTHILVIGVAYKAGVADIRESPALPIISLLRKEGLRVSYWDPLVPSLKLDGETLTSLDLERDGLPQDLACAVITTPHPGFDYAALCRQVPKVFDTRNALGHLSFPNVVRL